MTELLNVRVAAAVLGGLLALGSIRATSAKAEGVPASFDCAKAERAVDRFICAHAVLRWQDLALSRSYKAAKAAAVGPARHDLVSGQRDWLCERDRRCIADRSYKELSGPSNALRNQAYGCLNTVYLDRRRTLQDLGVKPLVPTGIAEIDLKPIAAARPEIVEGSGPRIAGIKASPDGSMLAILLPSLELDLPDQIWLYRVADRKLVAATPKPDQEQTHPDGAVAAIKSLAWKGDTMYARVATWGKGGEGGKGTTAVYAATVDVSRRLDKVPGDIDAALDEADRTGAVKQDEVPKSEWDILETIRGNRDFLVWAYDLGHGTIELRMRKRVRGSPIYLVAWGSWDLWRYLFDISRSQLIFSADTGLTAFDMTTHDGQRIAGTSRGDHPYVISADHRLLVWSTRNHCGDEFLTEPDGSVPERVCLAHLPKPRRG